MLVTVQPLLLLPSSLSHPPRPASRLVIPLPPPPPPPRTSPGHSPPHVTMPIRVADPRKATLARGPVRASGVSPDHPDVLSTCADKRIAVSSLLLGFEHNLLEDDLRRG
eukprot:748476-Hanusia_phi.AAC.3